MVTKRIGDRGSCSGLDPAGELTVLRRSSSWFKGAEKIRKDRRAEEGRGKRQKEMRGGKEVGEGV